MTITNYKKYTAKIPVGLTQPYPAKDWFLIELPEPLILGSNLYMYKVADSSGIIINLVNLYELELYEEIVRIHNENILLGISDEAYNETINEV